MELYREKNTATRITFPIVNATGDTVTGATGLDSETTNWADGSNPGSFTDCTNEATEIGATGVYHLTLTAAEMNFDYVYVQIKTTSSGAKTQHILIQTKAKAAHAAIQADTDDIQTRIPAALVGGRIDASVGAIATGAITAASIADGAIDAATFAAGAINAAAIADGAIDAATFAAGAIDAAAIATDAIGASELAAGAANKIRDTIISDATPFAGANIDAAISTLASQTSVDDLPTNAELAIALGTADDAVLAQVALVKAVTDKLDTALELDGAVYRFTVNALELAPTGGSAPTAAEIADEVRVELTTELGRIDAAVSTRATPAQVATELATYDGPTNAEMVARTLATADYATAANLATVAGYLDTEIAAIKAKTDSLPADPAGLAALAAAHGAGSWATATGFAEAGDAMTLTAQERTDLAVRAKSIDMATVKAAGTPGDYSEYTEIMMHLRSGTIAAGVLPVKNPDGTAWKNVAITVTPDADPVTATGGVS